MNARLTRLLPVCLLINALDGYDISALGLAIPSLSSEWNLAPEALRAATLTSLGGMALGAFAVGPLAQRFETRRLLLALLITAALSCLGAAAAESVAHLAAWRLATGIAVGAILPLVLATVAGSIAPEHRARWVALMAAAVGLGTIVASFAAPVLLAAGGWRYMFLAGAIAPVVLLPLVWFGLPAGTVQSGPRTAGEQAWRMVGSLLSPSLRRRTVLLWISLGCSLFVVYSLLSWLPSLLVEDGWAIADAARAAGWLGIGGMAGGLLLAWQVDRGHTRVALASGFAVSVFVLAGIALTEWSRHAWFGLLLALGLCTFGSQLAIGALSATMYPAALRVTGIGWAGGMGRICAWVGPMGVAALMQAGVSVRAVLGLLAVPQFVCLACVLLLPDGFQKTEREQK